MPTHPAKKSPVFAQLIPLLIWLYALAHQLVGLLRSLLHPKPHKSDSIHRPKVVKNWRWDPKLRKFRPEMDTYTRILEGFRYYLPFLMQAWVYWILDCLRVILPVWPKKSIKGQLMLITGTGSGMGRASAIEFSKQGVRLIMWDVNEEANKETQKILHELGYHDNVTMTVDLASPKAIDEAGERVRNEYGIPDLVFNNAGINGGFLLMECDLEKYDLTMTVNTKAMVCVNKQFLQQMVDRNSGHLVALTSIAGYQGAGGLIAYSMSKYAAVGYMESVRNEFKAKHINIKCTTIAPYYVKTNLTRGVEYDNFFAPMKTPDYVASRICEAVLTDQEELFVPNWSWTYVVLKGILPTRVMDVFTAAFEVHTLPIGFEKFRQQQKLAAEQKQH
ncbi:Protein dhs-3 [Aphelenchoides bicaudatus]|nr:Protein dhs-3 [Aphelenchoides bicaudatus]